MGAGDQGQAHLSRLSASPYRRDCLPASEQMLAMASDA